MSVGSVDPAGMVQRALEYAASNLWISELLIQVGLDPGNITTDAIFNRLFDLALASITFGNVLALIGGIFLVWSFVVRTIVTMRVLCIVSIVFFLGSAALAASVPKFLMYFFALPANVVRLYQIRNLIKKARNSAQGTLSLDWLRPFMTPRSYNKGDVLFHKGDPATEMFLTVSGKFLVTEIKIEIPPDRILGELGFLTPNNSRTQSVECIEDGEILTISYDKLNELYLESPEFGYYFLRLTSDRLLQNHARLEGLVEKSKTELAALTAPKAGNKKKQKAGAEPTDPAEIVAVQRRRAVEIVERHANYSAMGGFVPLPVVNVATITAVLVRMVKRLSEVYGSPYEDNRAYSIVVGLMGGVMPTRLAAVVSSTYLHFVPGFNLVGIAVSSVTAAAYARRIGWMLIDHFEREAELERRRHLLQSARRWTVVWPSRWARAWRRDELDDDFDLESDFRSRLRDWMPRLRAPE